MNQKTEYNVSTNKEKRYNSMANLISIIITMAMLVSANITSTKDKVEVWSMSLVRTSNGICYCVDENGEGWEFYGDNYKCGQTLVVLHNGEIVDAF